LEIVQIDNEAAFLGDVYFVLEKKEQRSTNLFLPRVFMNMGDAVKFVRETQSDLKKMGLNYTVKYFIFKGTSVDYS
jgi:hypothetical protein